MSHAAIDAVVSVVGLTYLAMRVRVLLGRLADRLLALARTTRDRDYENGVGRG